MDNDPDLQLQLLEGRLLVERIADDIENGRFTKVLVLGITDEEHVVLYGTGETPTEAHPSLDMLGALEVAKAFLGGGLAKRSRRGRKKSGDGGDGGNDGSSLQ